MPIATSTIRQLLNRVTEGEIRIPAFQREFVWDSDRIQFLMDSIYKGFPIGTLLFWRTREQLQSDRDLGPYSLPEPKEQYPIDYVLDGQQRLTSIFSIFQTDLTQNKNSNPKWLDVYFDMSANENNQDSQFIALLPEDVEIEKHFPLNIFFNVGEYGAKVRQLSDEKALMIDRVRNQFQEAQIPIETIETSDHSKVAIVFERINRGGVSLDTYQLLAAWTWNGEFDLRSRFDDLSIELDDLGYGDLGTDPDLLLKCAAVVISNDCSTHAVVALKGADVRDRFREITNGIKGAVDFLSKQCGVVSLKILPYKSMLIPLVKFFATINDNGFHPTAIQNNTLRAWFWHSCFSRRYSNSVDTALESDIKSCTKLKNDNDPSGFNLNPPKIGEDFFTGNVFSLNAVNTKTFVLLLASKKPKSFLSGTNIDLNKVLLNCNRTEFHHIFPKNYLDTELNIKSRDAQFQLANFAFLSQTDNRKIKNKSPAVYVNDISMTDRNEILERSIIPSIELTGTYEAFCKARASMLVSEALTLCRPEIFKDRA